MVVVRGSGDSAGQFQIAATAVDITELSLGETVASEVQSADVPVGWTLDVPDGSDVIVTVTPTGDLDVALEVVDPNGETNFVDLVGAGEAELADLTSAGRHVMRVTGFDGSVGSFKSWPRR